MPRADVPAPRSPRSPGAATTLLALLGVMLASSACAPGAKESPDLEAYKQELMEADRAFARATAREGVDGWVAYFSEEGVMFRGSEELVRGPEEIRAHMAAAFADSTFSLEWEPREARASRSGDLGYTLGRYESRTAGPEGPEIRTGWYVTLWRRQADGTWKAELDMGDPDREAPSS